MRPIIRISVLAVVLMSTAAAFAQNNVRVDIPFSFETYGKIFPAGSYEVGFDPHYHALKLSGTINRKIIYIGIASPAEFGPSALTVSLRFDHAADGTRVLGSILFGDWATPVLDKCDKYLAQYQLSSTGGL
jgi:hypothetical protein